MGFGFSHYVLYLHMQKTFNKRRGLATGLFAATRAASAALMPHLALLLSGQMGYANMMRVMAAMALLGVVFSSVQTHNDKFKPAHMESFRRSVNKATAASTLALPQCVVDKEKGSQGNGKRPRMADMVIKPAGKDSKADHELAHGTLAPATNKGQSKDTIDKVKMWLLSSEISRYPLFGI
jgi:hypothetical protein